jgi:hypothetical protein
MKRRRIENFMIGGKHGHDRFHFPAAAKQGSIGAIG